ncbi:hypothetical protein HZA99_01445 [Candidatus Woesearchaeota archaeon]|nr:hypothetical protein [Candidatus Woesearchaeota archaeon]
METQGKAQATVGKTKGLSAKKTGAASGHVFRQTGEGVMVGQQSGLATVAGGGNRGLKKAKK